MLEGWAVAHNLLWVLALAMLLAVLSVTNYEARTSRHRLRQKLARSRFALAASIALALFCAGLFFAPRAWWERATWVLFALLFARRAAYLARRAHCPPQASHSAHQREEGSGT